MEEIKNQNVLISLKNGVVVEGFVVNIGSFIRVVEYNNNIVLVNYNDISLIRLFRDNFTQTTEQKTYMEEENYNEINNWDKENSYDEKEEEKQEYESQINLFTKQKSTPDYSMDMNVKDIKMKNPEFKRKT